MSQLNCVVLRKNALFVFGHTLRYKSNASELSNSFLTLGPDHEHRTCLMNLEHIGYLLNTISKNFNTAALI